MKTQALNNWREGKLGEIISINPDSIGKNFDFDEILYTDISSVGTGVADQPTILNLSEAPSRARRLIKNGDTILSTVRPNRRSFLYVKNPQENRVVSTGFAVLRASENIDSRFLYYLISDQSFTDYLTRNAKGAAYPAVDEEIIANAKIVIPEIKTQKQVANVLSAYDDLIENNTRRIKILEQMAQAIYTEWFINFRFPGHGKVKMIDSVTDFGKIPEGWEVKSLGAAVYSFDSKRRPISKMKRLQMQGEIPYYGAAKIIDYVNEVLFEGKYLLLAEDGSVITKEGNPVLQFVNEKFWVSNHAHVLQGKAVSTEHLYIALSKVQIQGYITGAAQPKITQENMNRIPVLIPDPNTNSQFDSLIVPIFDLKFNLENNIKNLRQTRDLLLPKLVTGEIRV